MSATQLLRILQTLPACADDEICVFNTDELEESMKRGSRCTNPFLSNEEDNEVNFWNSRPELERSSFGNDYTNDQEYDQMFRKPSAACNGNSHLLAKTTGFRIDKHSVEYELPELVVCYKDKESDFHVKDANIDEGLPDEESISVHKDNNHRFIHNSGLVNGDDDDMIEASLHDTEFLKHEWLRSSTVACCYTDVELDSSNICEETLSLSTNLQGVYTDQRASNSKISLQQDWSPTPITLRVSSKLYDDHINQYSLQSSKDKHGKGAVVGHIAQEQDKDCQLKTISNESKIKQDVIFHFNTSKTKDSNPCGAMIPESTYEPPLETESVVNQQDAASGDHDTRYVAGESSFSMAGVISELISCSRPMPLAGGISTRSDSSANSNRSFAFPTLETEYASSPVRMVKADRKRLQKQRGWRKGLLCCKF